MDKFAYIVIDLVSSNLNKPFLYKIPNELVDILKIGDKVIIPFGKNNKNIEGFVIFIGDFQDLINNNIDDKYILTITDINSIKYIITKANNKISINDILLKLSLYISDEYDVPLSLAFKTVLPVKRKISRNIKTKDVVLNYDILKKNIVLNSEQKLIVNDLLESYNKKNYSEHLVYGITGSGKTEVYIEIIKKVIESNKTVILMIPEISLTYQTISRLKSTFNEDIAILNSKMSDGEKYVQYKKCLDGVAKIIVGPRSVIFAPFLNLGLVIIDEEDDISYKSDMSPRLNAIDVARYRCKLQNSMLILLSATPSISTFYKAKNNLIKLHKLTKRANENVNLPKVYIVDMTKEFKKGNKSSFSLLLKNKISANIEEHKQTMLFLNRRGFEKFIICLECGKVYKCPHCDVSLTIHNDGTLKCHYCGYTENITPSCKYCGSTKLTSFKMGTQKLEEICKKEFPNAKILRLDLDIARKKGAVDNVIKLFSEHKADILIGTQMIAKGHDFDNVTICGIMCADMSLNISSYKATENTFSLMTQMIGRAGRKISGECVLQTYMPDNLVLNLAKNQNYEKFYDEEIKYRKMLNYPPFCSLVTVVLKCYDESILNDFSKNLKTYLEIYNEHKNVILGPNIPYISKIKDEHLRVFYVKCKEYEFVKDVRTKIKKFVNTKKLNKILKIIIDVEK